MQPISTIDELESVVEAMALKGVQISFGPSLSPLRKGQWFAGDGTRQERGPTLRDALNALLGLQPSVDLITEPVKPVKVAKAAAAPDTNLTDLLG